LSTTPTFRNLLGCVDCLQADVTRCGGITGFPRAGALAEAFDLELSAHCTPSASVDAVSPSGRRLVPSASAQAA